MTELMTLEELASYLRVTKKTIYRLLDKGVLPSTRVGHLWRFSKAAIDEWLMQKPDRARMNILVVDDDEMMRTIFQDVLTDEGHSLVATGDPFAALELVRNSNFDLVFLDLMMPDLNGAELFKRIREIRPELPVTIVTGYPNSELMMSAMETGPFSVMKKPFASSDIVSSISNYIRLGRL
jgi:excisionase family DNA binding protein